MKIYNTPNGKIGIDFEKVVAFNFSWRNYSSSPFAFSLANIRVLDVYLSPSKFGEPVKLQFDLDLFDPMCDNPAKETYYGQKIYEDLITHFSNNSRE